MDVYLQPGVSCHLIMTIIGQWRKIFEELKNSQATV